MKLVSEDETQSYFLTCTMSGLGEIFCHILLTWITPILVWRKLSTAWECTFMYTQCCRSSRRAIDGIALHGEALVPISSLLSPAFPCEVVKSIYNLSSKKLSASNKINPDPSFPFATRTPAAKLPGNLSDLADLRKDGISFFCYF